MKKFLFFAIALAMVGCGKDDTAGSKSENLPPLPDANDVCSAMDDTAFAQFCIDKFDTNHDGKLSPEEAAAVTEIIDDGNGIKSFKGIEYFTALRKFTSSYNSDVQKIDLHYNTQMTTIAESAFEACYGLEEVILPPTLRTIAEMAFSECESLKAIDLPDTVTTIDDLAFNGCIAITSITLPSKLATIGEYAFSGCENLSGVITIPDSVTTLEEGAFTACPLISGFSGKFATADKRCLIADGLLVSVVTAGLTSFTTPDNITAIGGFTFYGCENLTSITLPANLKAIGEYAFYESGLTSITIPEGVLAIEDRAFSDCTALRSIVIPDSVVELGNAIFIYCTALESATLGKGITEITEFMFHKCEKLKEITIADGAKVTLIGNSAFSGCSNLTKFVAPDTVTEIENAAFYRCTALSSMTIGKATTTIGNNVFYQCLNLFNVYCKATTPPQLGDKVFDSNPATAKIYVPKGYGAAYKAADGWKDVASKIEEIYFM